MHSESALGTALGTPRGMGVSARKDRSSQHVLIPTCDGEGPGSRCVPGHMNGADTGSEGFLGTGGPALRRLAQQKESNKCGP